MPNDPSTAETYYGLGMIHYSRAVKRLRAQRPAEGAEAVAAEGATAAASKASQREVEQGDAAVRRALEGALVLDPKHANARAYLALHLARVGSRLAAGASRVGALKEARAQAEKALALTQRESVKAGAIARLGLTTAITAGLDGSALRRGPCTYKKSPGGPDCVRRVDRDVMIDAIQQLCTTPSESEPSPLGSHLDQSELADAHAFLASFKLDGLKTVGVLWMDGCLVGWMIGCGLRTMSTAMHIDMDTDLAVRLRIA